uniref:Peptidase C51 domain-containing protein n=1 Tax=Rhodopseudomonas palustris (strain BisA53) TaxID=316055 RepID=Q07IH2_RHOP5
MRIFGMIEFNAFRRLVRFSTLALVSAAFAAIATPSSARPQHGAARHLDAHQAQQRHHHFKRHYTKRHYSKRHRGHVARRAAPVANGFAQDAMTGYGYGDSYASLNAQPQTQPPTRSRTKRSRLQSQEQFQTQSYGGGFGGSGLVAEARRYIGGNPTGRSALWCARFMNMVLERAGLRGTGSDMARSFASYGQRVSGPQVGAIAVMSRGKRGGHVGVVSGVDASGNPIVVSGNHNRRVAEAVYPRGRVFAYVMP